MTKSGSFNNGTRDLQPTVWSTLQKHFCKTPEQKDSHSLVWKESFTGWSCNHNASFGGAAFVSLPCHLDFVGCCCCVNMLYTWWLVLLRIADQELELHKAVKSCLLPWRTGKLGWCQHSRTGWNRWGAERMAAARWLRSLHHSLPPSEQAGWVAMETLPLG